MIRIELIDDNGCFIDFWNNFDDYEPEWLKILNASAEEILDYNKHWENYCNEILKGFGVLHYYNNDSDLDNTNVYINFYSEEDMTAFILRWS